MDTVTHVGRPADTRDLESWRNRERARAIAEGDAAKLVRADLIMKRARRSARVNVTKVAR